MLVVAVLLTTVLMRVAIIGAVAYLLLPQGFLCPHCGVEMVAIRNRIGDRPVAPTPERQSLGDGVCRLPRAKKELRVAAMPEPPRERRGRRDASSPVAPCR